MTLSRSRSISAALIAALALSLLAVSPSPANAHPDACEKSEGVTSFGAFHAVLGFANIFSSFFGTDVAEDVHEEECFSDELIANLDDSSAQLAPGEVASRNIEHLANIPKSGPFTGTAAYMSDLAFWGDYALQGNYNGVQIVDISTPASPKVVSQASCPGSQNDISVWENLLVTSTDSIRTDSSCSSSAVSGAVARGLSSAQQANLWEGIRIWDWSDPANPRVVANVKTFCGSHTHTILPEPEKDRLLVYVSSYDVPSNYDNCHERNGVRWTNISVVEVPLSNPAAARVIGTPNIWANGGFTAVTLNPAEGRNRVTNGCHDITVYQAKGLAAGACTGEGVIMDISTPENPKVIAQMTDRNFVFWHSATFSHDGKAVLFTDELGGGGSPTCNPDIGPNRGANGIYDLTDPRAPKFASYWKIPRTQSNTENCVAHNGNLLPVEGRTIMVQAWYQGGIAVTDWTDPYNPYEIAWFDRGPLSPTSLILGGSWSAYWHNGKIYSSDIQQGFDVFDLTGKALNGKERGEAMSAKLPHANAQVQFPPPVHPSNQGGKGKGR